MPNFCDIHADTVGKWIRENKPQEFARIQELKKLEPYKNNAAHFRMIREEVKQAAKDGKTKLQFPTGETAMKIEGLGSGNKRWQVGAYGENGVDLAVDRVRVGLPVNDGNTEWIITDVLGDGKFKAVPKEKYESIPTMAGGATRRDIEMERASETFDISGKVDTENPIFRFYDKEVRRYLTSKYNAREIVDPQGVSWIELDIKPEYKRMPVEAFGIGAIPFFNQEDSK